MKTELTVSKSNHVSKSHSFTGYKVSYWHNGVITVVETCRRAVMNLPPWKTSSASRFCPGK